MNFSPKKNQENNVSLEQLIKKLEINGDYKIVDQKPGQDSVEINGQKVIIPFTNMSGLKVVLKNEDEVWTYLTRGNKSDLQGVITAILGQIK